MRRLLAWLLLAVVSVAFVGCGESEAQKAERMRKEQMNQGLQSLEGERDNAVK